MDEIKYVFEKVLISMGVAAGVTWIMFFLYGRQPNSDFQALVMFALSFNVSIATHLVVHLIRIKATNNDDR